MVSQKGNNLHVVTAVAPSGERKDNGCDFQLRYSLVDGTYRQNRGYSWAYSAQTVRPAAKVTLKRHIIGMSSSPQNDFFRQKLCRLSCTPRTSTHPRQ